MARSLELPYDVSTGCADRHGWFERLRPMGWAVFLDSGDRARTGGRYDILAADPVARLVVREGKVEILRNGEPRAVPEDAFAGLRTLLAGTAAGDEGWPAAGGAIGYLGYELGRSVARLPAQKEGTVAFMPDAAMGLYAWTIVVDQAERRAALTSLAPGTVAMDPFSKQLSGKALG